MGDAIRAALHEDRLIDITTTGRRSGEPRRIEIWFHRVAQRYYITGSPGHRSWYANLLANPNFTFHLKRSAQANLPATAIPVIDPEERLRILRGMTTLADSVTDKDLQNSWVQRSPLVQVFFHDS